VTARREMPAGLRGAYLRVLTPVAALAPVPLIWTGGTSAFAIAIYEAVLLWLAWRGRGGRPVRVSDAMLNLAGVLYLAWLGFETATLRVGLLRSVSHLLLFTALAKLASLKRPSEARLALLVLFLLTLAAASSSTHVSSLLYFAAMAWLGFRTLSLLAVLADFDDAPPERVLRSIPTHGLTAAAIAGGVLLSVPLFFVLPRLHGPFAVAPFRVDDAFSKAISSDRVDLDSFTAAKRSDRVILRLSSSSQLPGEDALRLREAVFTNYDSGVWLRDPRAGTRRGERSAYAAGPAAGEQAPTSLVSVDLNVYGQGFLFLPYGTFAVRVEKGRASEMPDGVMQIGSGRGPVRYEADVREGRSRGPGRGVIAISDVPDAVQQYALQLTGELTDPAAIYRRIEEQFRKDFIYTLEPPKAKGDPIEHFLLRSKAGHCEYFASAAAMMLATRGIRARLVTGSYGGESGLFSSAIVVRAQNLHAWVEADLDGSGFRVLDPTPPAGIPPALQSFSFLSRLGALGREIEFLYDRRILGFDSGDQIGVAEAVRESMGSAASRLTAFSRTARSLVSAATAAMLLCAAGLVWLLLRGVSAWRAGVAPATHAYLSLRRLLGRRRGPVAPSVPPAEVARLFAEEVPAGREDAHAVVTIYCASAFGGIEPEPATLRELSLRVRRLKRLA
jgi:transglutaminase-like putative cysteine protease